MYIGTMSSFFVSRRLAKFAAATRTLAVCKVLSGMLGPCDSHGQGRGGVVQGWIETALDGSFPGTRSHATDRRDPDDSSQ